MKKSSTQFIPVPDEQIPLNEYKQLQESWFFRWVTLSRLEFGSKLAYIWAVSLFITAPIASASFPPDKATFSFILATTLASTFFVGVALLRLYLGWSYIGDRLNQEKITYEESGWYDGQEWKKTVEMLMQDRLVFSYQVQPILKRLKKSALILLSLISSGSLIFLFISK